MSGRRLILVLAFMTLGFASIFIVPKLYEEFFGETQSFADKNRLTLTECEARMETFGLSRADANIRCTARVPRTTPASNP